MKILLIGGSGQLGGALKNLIGNKNELFLPNSKDLDISHQESVNNFLDNWLPEIVVNCAAYTNVDEAEIDQDKSYKVNTLGPSYLSLKTNELNSLLIHISTDYVFGGKGVGPFSSNDITSPVNYYGYTKDMGEKMVFKNTDKYILIRTSSLMSAKEGNFTSKIYSKLVNKEKIRMIENQNITMTCANNLASFINILIMNYQSLVDGGLCKDKVIHFTNLGYTNWFSIASRVQERLINEKIIKNNNFIEPISSEDWKSKALRPSDSRLSINLDLLEKLNVEPIRWEESLDKIVNELILKQ